MRTLKALLIHLLLPLVFALAVCAIGASTALADDVVKSGGDFTATQWDESIAPNYYRVDGKAILTHGNLAKDDQIHAGTLDSRKRASWSAGYITPVLWAKEDGEDREDSNLPNPVGWKSNAQTVIPFANGWGQYSGWFWNRSHLVADSLGGQPIKQNLVTGTRTQNVGTNNKGGSGFGGMAYTEEKARQYMKSHPSGCLYYSAIPVYVGDELVPRSVYVDMKSADGVIDEHVEVYNTAANHVVYYADGSWSENEDPNATRKDLPTVAQLLASRESGIPAADITGGTRLPRFASTQVVKSSGKYSLRFHDSASAAKGSISGTNFISNGKAGAVSIDICSPDGTTTYQKFDLTVYALSGCYVLRNGANPDFAVNVKAGSSANGANIAIWKANGSDAQKFEFILQPDGTYKLRNKRSGKMIAVAGNSTKENSNIYQWQSKGVTGQKWKIRVDSKNRITLMNKTSNKALTPTAGSVVNGRNIKQLSNADMTKQKWSLESTR